MSTIFLEATSNHTTNKEIQFLLCQSCFWCASSYNIIVNDPSITRIVNCPSCDNNKIESMPISENEVYRVDHNPKTGIVLEFQK